MRGLEDVDPGCARAFSEELECSIVIAGSEVQEGRRLVGLKVYQAEATNTCLRELSDIDQPYAASPQALTKQSSYFF